MRPFADVEEIGLGASAPPREIRMDLAPGDVAVLYAPVLDGQGEALAPVEALVVGVPEPGIYMGELPDGSQIGFDASNVAHLAPAMGGIFDWIKRTAKAIRPPVPGLPGLPPAPPERAIILAPPPSAPPAPPAPPKRSFWDIFRPSAPPGVPPPAKPSIFDIFRPEVVPPGLPIVRPEAPPPAVIPPPGASIFAAFAPEAPGVLQALRERAAAIVPTEEALRKLIPEAPKIFAFAQPSPVETFEAKQARQLELWKGIFPDAQEEMPLRDMFAAFKPTETVPEEQARAPQIPSDAKVLPLPPRNTILPTAMDVARGFITFYQPIEELWEYIRSFRQRPEFQNEVRKGERGEGPGGKVMFETLGTCGDHPDVFEETSSFFGIPWDEFRNRGGIVVEEDEQGNQYERMTDTRQITEDVFFPLSEIVYEAFEMMKPKNLPGFFTLEFTPPHGCEVAVTYVEGAPMVPGGFAGGGPHESQRPEPAPAQEAAPPMQSRQLGEVVPAEIFEEMTDHLNDAIGEHISIQDMKRKLLKLMEPHRQYMDARGVIPEYVVAYLARAVETGAIQPEEMPRPKKKKRSR